MAENVHHFSTLVCKHGARQLSVCLRQKLSWTLSCLPNQEGKHSEAVAVAPYKPHRSMYYLT